MASAPANQPAAEGGGWGTESLAFTYDWPASEQERRSGSSTRMTTPCAPIMYDLIRMHWSEGFDSLNASPVSEANLVQPL